mgnify:CR=1 FL=1
MKKNEIWAGFRPVDNTEKKSDQLWATFEVGFFIFLGAKKKLIFFKYCMVRTKKLKNEVKKRLGDDLKI